MKIGEESYPILLSEWIEGESLKSYINKHLTNKGELINLQKQIREVLNYFRVYKVSHGDFAPENMVITSNKILKLIDYDTFFTNKRDEEQELYGRLDYQHPKRVFQKSKHWKSDYFSGLIIYLGLTVLIKRPNLWYEYSVLDSNSFFFEKGDYEDIKNSKTYNDLKKICDNEIDYLLNILQIFCETEKMDDLLSLDFILENFENKTLKVQFGLPKTFNSIRKIKKEPLIDVTIKERCKKLIQKAKVQECLESLKILFNKNNIELSSHIILLNHSWEKISQDKIKGIYSREIIEMEERRIIVNILSILNKY